jgi:hypothetical protein
MISSCLNNVCGLNLDRDVLLHLVPTALTSPMLSLINKKIASIDSSCFNGMSNVDVLWLSENDIAHLNTTTFDGLVNLNY